MSSIILTTTGGAVGCLTMNPIIIGVLTGAGVIIQGYVTKSRLNREVD